jgi:hypothetical protein
MKKYSYGLVVAVAIIVVLGFNPMFSVPAILTLGAIYFLISRKTEIKAYDTIQGECASIREERLARMYPIQSEQQEKRDTKELVKMAKDRFYGREVIVKDGDVIAYTTAGKRRIVPIYLGDKIVGIRDVGLLEGHPHKKYVPADYIREIPEVTLKKTAQKALDNVDLEKRIVEAEEQGLPFYSIYKSDFTDPRLFSIAAEILREEGDRVEISGNSIEVYYLDDEEVDVENIQIFADNRDAEDFSEMFADC